MTTLGWNTLGHTYAPYWKVRRRTITYSICRQSIVLCVKGEGIRVEVKFPGHIYLLEVRRSPNECYVQAPAEVKFMRFEGDDTEQWSGVTTQEILRCLIDRTWYCDSCLPSHLNDYIVHHLRMALVLHEARALLRKV